MVLMKIILLTLCCLYVESCRSSPPAPPPPPVEPKPLPAPKILNTTMEYPDNFIVTWEGVPEDQLQKEYPIKGYNVSLWVDNRVRYRATPTGVRGPEYEYPMKIVPRIPETEPVSVIVGPDVRAAKFTVEPQVAYQVRVMAFTDKTKGPFSFPETFKLLKSNKDH